MTLIALQNDFLPTDTLGDATISTFNSNMMGVAFLGIFIGGIVFAFAEFLSESKVGAILGMGMLIACVGPFIYFGIQAGNDQTDYNIALEESKVADVSNFAANIEAAYDVKVILPDEEDYSVTPEKERSITVVQDDTAYSALVSQDKVTYEPTLIMVAAEASNIQAFRKK